jgi:hypothetical protein
MTDEPLDYHGQPIDFGAWYFARKRRDGATIGCGVYFISPSGTLWFQCVSSGVTWLATDIEAVRIDPEKLFAREGE